MCAHSFLFILYSAVLPLSSASISAEQLACVGLRVRDSHIYLYTCAATQFLWCARSFHPRACNAGFTAPERAPSLFLSLTYDSSALRSPRRSALSMRRERGSAVSRSLPSSPDSLYFFLSLSCTVDARAITCTTRACRRFVCSWAAPYWILFRRKLVAFARSLLGTQLCLHPFLPLFSEQIFSFSILLFGFYYHFHNSFNGFEFIFNLAYIFSISLSFNLFVLRFHFSI